MSSSSSSSSLPSSSALQVLTLLQEYERTHVEGNGALKQALWKLYKSRHLRKRHNLGYVAETYCSASNLRAQGSLHPRLTVQYHAPCPPCPPPAGEKEEGIRVGVTRSESSSSSSSRVDWIGSFACLEDGRVVSTLIENNQDQDQQSKEQQRQQDIKESNEKIKREEEEVTSSSNLAPLLVNQEEVEEEHGNNHDYHHDSVASPQDGLRNRRGQKSKPQPPNANYSPNKGSSTSPWTVEHSKDNNKNNGEHSNNNTDKNNNKNDVTWLQTLQQEEEQRRQRQRKQENKEQYSERSSSSVMVDDPLELLAGALPPKELRQAQHEARRAIQCYIAAANLWLQLQQQLQQEQQQQQKQQTQTNAGQPE